MPLNPAVAAGIAAEVDGIFTDAANVLRDGEGNYLRNGQPESISGQISQAAGRQACRRYARDPSAVSGRRQQQLDRACAPYLRQIGEYPGGGTLKPPFQGGQCPGVTYLVTASGPNRCRSFDPTTAAFVDGPIRGIRAVPTSGTDCQGNPSSRVEIQNGAGVWVATSVGNIPRDQAPSYSIVSAVRVDGRPDNCGNPPPDFLPPSPIPGPLPPVRINPSVDVDITIDVDFSPSGEINIEFDPEGGGPTVPIDPFGDDEGGGPDEGPGVPGPPEVPVESPDGNGGFQRCYGQSLTGVRVDILEIPPKANQEKGQPSALLYSAGWIAFSPNGEAWAMAADRMIRDNQFVPSPGKGYNCVQAKVSKGWTIRLTPFFAENDEEDD